jgi:hypothetical protein
MRSLRSLLVAFFLIALLLAASSAALGAASPNEVSGTITVATNTGSIAEVEFGGSLVGSATEVYTAASHDGKLILHGMGSFTGTFEGRSVSFTYRFNGHTEGESLVGQITIDPLSGVQGHLSFEGVGNDFTYDGLIVL